MAKLENCMLPGFEKVEGYSVDPYGRKKKGSSTTPKPTGRRKKPGTQSGNWYDDNLGFPKEI